MTYDYEFCFIFEPFAEASANEHRSECVSGSLFVGAQLIILTVVANSCPSI